MKRPKIVIVGGGSSAWTPKLVRDILMTGALAEAEIVLYDINKPAAELVLRFLEKLNARLKTGAVLSATDDRAAAFDGGDYFIIAIAVGGLRAMAHDLAIPEDYGVHHTVGDTSGPGGWARLMRNQAVFFELAHAIGRYASKAAVLNYTNPLTPLTMILARICAGPVVGLCHGLFENIEFLKRVYACEEADISLQYGGLNHFFWIKEARAGRRDLLKDLRARCAHESLSGFLKEEWEPGTTTRREVATELFRETGEFPYLGDRHTAEFFPHYITSRTALRAYGLVRTSIRAREQAAVLRVRFLRQCLAGGLPREFLARSRETAADIIAAHATGRAFIDVGNLPNAGQISNLPRGLVVETAVRIDGNGFSPICYGALPSKVLGLVEPCAGVFSLGVEACFQKDRGLALQALRLDPVCGRLNRPALNEMAGRLLRAGNPYVPNWLLR